MYSDKLSIDEICARFKVLYSGAISDILDELGYREQVLPNYIRPLKEEWKVAGPAFTAYGERCDDICESDIETRIKMMESVERNQVCVWDAEGDNVSSHWGELMSLGVRNNGGQGAVVNGGVRDIAQIYDLNFPVFGKFRSPYTAIGRFQLKISQKPITIGGVTVNPNDFVFGDVDGIVIIPKDIVEDVLMKAENIYYRERKMLIELRMGHSISEIYDRYGVF